MATHYERFHQVMNYQPCGRVPNYELGMWGQTVDRWLQEGADQADIEGDWFTGVEALGMDYREFIPVSFGMHPTFETKVLERSDRYEVVQRADGRVTKALIPGTVRGTRASMDQYLRFAVENADDWADVKRRFDPSLPERQPADWQGRLDEWRERSHVLVLGRNCAPEGFYWRARTLMGTEGLSFAWYDQPEMLHDMMATYADFTMEVCRPIVEAAEGIDYFNYNEDMAMKSGPLLGPDTFKTFIFPHLKRLNEFLKSNGVRYISVDTDGNAEPLIPLLLDAGVDILWPMERAADMDPVRIRKEYGKSLRLMGGVDKRELAKGPEAIRQHLKTLIPLVEEGGFFPTVDHTVPPDVSWNHFRHYMDLKHAMLAGDYRAF